MITIVIRSPANLLIDDWTYVPSSPTLQIRRLRAQNWLFKRRRAPPYRVAKPPYPARRWNVLFLYLPNGNLGADQSKIIDRIRRLSGQLMIVYASPNADAPVPMGLRVADSLIWKGLTGFDFSAYAIALDTIAQYSPGATTYVQNDSVLGPFADIDVLVARARWDLTGFIASPMIENHLSSFAFILHDTTPSRVASLAPAMSKKWSYGTFMPVVLCQESRLARAASRSMTVGSFLYMPVKPVTLSLYSRLMHRARPKSAARYPLDLSSDPTLGTPLELLDRGFPFLKRSLFGKFAAVSEHAPLEQRLSELNW